MSTRYEISEIRIELRIRIVVHVVSAVEGEDRTLQALVPVSTEALQLAQSQIENLGSVTQVLTTALDELTKIHPFVTGTL